MTSLASTGGNYQGPTQGDVNNAANQAYTSLATGGQSDRPMVSQGGFQRMASR